MLPNVQTSPAPSVNPSPSGGGRSGIRSKGQGGNDPAASFGDLLADAGGSGASHASAAEADSSRVTKKVNRVADDDPTMAPAPTTPDSTAIPAPVSLHQMALNRPPEDTAKEKELEATATADNTQTMPTAPTAKVTIPAIRPHSPPVMDPGQQDTPPLKTQTYPIDPHGPPDHSDDEVTASGAGEFAPEVPTKLPPFVSGEDKAAANVPTKLPPVVSVNDEYVAEIPTKLPPVTGPAIPVNPNAQKAAVTGTGETTPKLPFPLIEPHGPPIQPSDEVTAESLTPTSASAGDPAETTKLARPVPPSPVPTKLPPVEVRDAKSIPVSLSAKPVTDLTLPDPNPPVVRTGTGILLPGDPAANAAAANPTLASPVEITNALQTQKLAAPVAPTAPATTPLPPEAVTERVIAAKPTGTEPILAPLAEQSTAVETDTTAATTPANLAYRRQVDTSRAAIVSKSQQAQVSDYEQLEYKQQLDGTSIAKEQADMTATLAEPAIDRSDLLRRGSGAPSDRATEIPGAEKAVAGLPTFQASVPGQGVHAAQAAPATGANAVVMADRVEHILQTVLDAGIKAGTQLDNQMDLRVRLDGGANDVTVRIQMNENRMHVTFQTDSTGLRQALEHGWSDFTAHAAKSAAVTVEPPGFTAAPQSHTQGTSDFSQGQQNPSQQDARRGFESEAPAFASAPRTAPAFTTSTTARPTPAPIQGTATRWTGWA